MSCPSYASLNEREFTAEMMIHSSGLRSVDDPGVFACPRISLCLECGCSRFTATEAQLRLLRTRIAESASAAA
jgi:hypothetical protein